MIDMKCLWKNDIWIKLRWNYDGRKHTYNKIINTIISLWTFFIAKANVVQGILLDCMIKLIMIIHMYHIIKWQFFLACQIQQSMRIETKDYPSKIVKKEQIMTTTLSWNETLSPIAIK